MCFPAAAPAVPAVVSGGIGGSAAFAGVPAATTVVAGSSFAFPSASTLITAGSIISTGIQTFATIRQARADSAESRYRSDIAAHNAAIAEQNAQVALQKGEADIADKRREIRQRIGLQKAQLAAMGFSVSEGSSIDILGDTAALGELDVLRIDADAQNRAANFRQQASGFQAESNLGRFASKNIKKAGTLKATSTLITGATTAGLTQLALKP